VALFFACYTEQDRDGAKDDGKVYVFKVPEKEIKFCDSDTAAILSLEIFQAEKPVNNVLLRFYPNDCLLFNTYFANLRRYFFKLRIAGDTVSIIANLCKHPASFSVGGIKRDCTDPKERELFNDENEIIYLVNEIREEKPYFEAQINYADLNSVVCLHPRMNNPRIIRQDGYFFVFGIDDEKRKPAKIQDEWQLRTITIPKEYKDDIMRQLDMLNINERFLFPDFQHFVYSINEKYRK
jgi:hypothetical protein